MVWAGMHWSPYALETQTLLLLLWLWQGCIGRRMLSKHERNYGFGMDALVTVCSRNTNVFMVWAWTHWLPYALETRKLLGFRHECSGHRMLSKHERDSGLGMNAVVTICSRHANVFMIWAGMHWSAYALETRT